MLIKLESFGHQLYTFVSVFNSSHQRVFTACPFGESRVGDAAISDGFFWCVKSDWGLRNGSGELCQINLNSGAVLSRKTHSIAQAKITFAPQSNVLLIYGLGGVAGFRLSPFDPIWELKVAFRKVTERRWFGKRTTYQLFDDRDMSVRSKGDLLCAGVPVEAPDGSVRIGLRPRDLSLSLQGRTDYQLKIGTLTGIHAVEHSKGSRGYQVVMEPPQIPSILKPIAYKSVDLPDLTYRDIEAHMKGLTRLKSWKQASVSEGLLGLSARLESGIEGVSRADGCELVFSVGNSMMDEWSFFSKLKAKNVDVLREVGVLLGAWLDALEASGRFFPSTDEDDDRAAGPMTGALAYLTASGAPCSDILRRFTLLRMPGQEGYSRDVLLTEYIDRQAPGSNEAIALKVFLIFLRERDGRIFFLEGEATYGWYELGILKSAQGNMSPSGFVDLILGEMSFFTPKTSPFKDPQEVWPGPLDGLKRLLDTNSEWDRDVKARLRITEVTE